MYRLIFLLCFVNLTSCAQNDTTPLPNESELVSMKNTTVQYSSKYGQQYFENGKDTPFTGWLCARYDNGELESIQQFQDGVGNGIWINFDPDGRKESQGTYLNNKTIGPAILYYEDGSIKAKGDYIHWKTKIGWWTFYDRQGNVVSKRYFTR